jgi:tRNA (cytidine/uridine-2'-O-)-methyltransferase
MFNIVLHEPEIPNNTGNIGRTCVATGCSLHLIHPLGFDTSEKACRRAGLDYWPRLKPREHPSWETYLTTEQPARLWFFSTHASRPLTGLTAPLLMPGDSLVFGKETRGLPPSLLHAHPTQSIMLPMIAGERSLNLATAVCAVIYLGLDHLQRAGMLSLTPAGRLNAPPTPDITRPPAPL